MESAWESFSEHYYADEEDARKKGLYDVAWTMDDAEQDANAPHQSLIVRYDSGLAAFSDLSLVADRLIQEPGLVALAIRIQRWAEEQKLSTKGDST